MNLIARLLFVAMLVSGLSAHARESSLASLLPANVIAYVATPNLGEFDSRWSATSFARLWESENIADFRDSFHGATSLAAKSQVSLSGIGWPQLLSVASGEACWALIPVGDEVGFLLLVDVGEHTDEATRLVAELQRQAPSRTYFLQNGVLGITNRKELANKPSATLVSSKPFAVVAERTHFPAALLHWFVDPWAFQSLALRSGAEGAARYWQQLADNGFKVVQAVGGAVSLATDQFDLEQRYFIYAPGERKKAARLLDFMSFEDQEIPKWIPADIESLTRIQWNLAGALAGYGSLFDAAYAEDIEGTFDAVLEDIEIEPTGPQVDIRALMKLQAGPVLSITKALEDGTTAVVYAVKVADEKSMANALLRMFGPDDGVDSKDVGQLKLWVFKDSEADAESGPPMGPDLAGYAMAAAYDYFFVSTSEAALKKILTDVQAPKLIQDEGFVQLEGQLRDQLTDRVIAIHHSPSAAGLRPAFDGLRMHGKIDLGQLIGDPQNDQHRLDLSTLPHGDTILNFIAAGFGFVSQSDDGWFLQDSIEKQER